MGGNLLLKWKLFWNGENWTISNHKEILDETECTQSSINTASVLE